MGKNLNASEQPIDGQSDCKRTLKQTLSRLSSQIRRNRVLWLSLAAFLLLAWLLTHTTCVFRSTIGIPCPGCGLSRAFILLLRGQWQQALHFHPLFWLVPPVTVIWAGLSIFMPKKLASPWLNRLLIVIGLLFIAVYVYRMIIFFPDTEPMVYNSASVLGRLWRLIQVLTG